MPYPEKIEKKNMPGSKAPAGMPAKKMAKAAVKAEPSKVKSAGKKVVGSKGKY
jgi:hypothetical protein